MAKIPKNLSDKSMVGNYKEEITFENDLYAEEDVTAKPLKGSEKDKPSFGSEFFTTELQEKIGKILLELKVELYKEGIVDFDIKVARQDKQVILTAVRVRKNKVGIAVEDNHARKYIFIS